MLKAINRPLPCDHADAAIGATAQARGPRSFAAEPHRGVGHGKSFASIGEIVQGCRHSSNRRPKALKHARRPHAGAAPPLTRTYVVTLGGKGIMRITERFPEYGM
jgi:hypothetical protein